MSHTTISYDRRCAGRIRITAFMLLLLGLVLFVASTPTARAQWNIVHNPSFEIADDPSSCPAITISNTATQEIALLEHWWNGTDATPDVFNACNTGSCSDPNTFVDVPNNTFGSQGAKTGDAYAGIIITETGHGAEYVVGTLTEQMVHGDVYRVEFWVSRSDYSIGAYRNLGAAFSGGRTYVPGFDPIDPEDPGNGLNLAFADTRIIEETGEWVRIFGTYTATGGENYITIGYFGKDFGGDKEQYGFLPTTCQPNDYFAYYYIDDVSVEKLTPGCCDPASIDLMVDKVETAESYCCFSLKTDNRMAEDCIYGVRLTASGVWPAPPVIGAEAKATDWSVTEQTSTSATWRSSTPLPNTGVFDIGRFCIHDMLGQGITFTVEYLDVNGNPLCSETITVGCEVNCICDPDLIHVMIAQEGSTSEGCCFSFTLSHGLPQDCIHAVKLTALGTFSAPPITSVGSASWTTFGTDGFTTTWSSLSPLPAGLSTTIGGFCIRDFSGNGVPFRIDYIGQDGTVLCSRTIVLNCYGSIFTQLESDADADRIEALTSLAPQG